MSVTIEVILGDITLQHVDAIVNPANERLRGGGGVDGAIHKRAGFDLLQECIAIGGCKKGQAVITKGYKLPARYVIHTVGPVYGRENGKEAEILASCYRSCLSLARTHGVRSIAFPSISTGAYGYPINQAAVIAAQEVQEYAKGYKNAFSLVCFVTHSQDDFSIYRDTLEKNSVI